MKSRICAAAIVALYSVAALPADGQQVRLETSLGDIVVELDPERAPVTVENFLTYVQDDFYDGLLFHRVDAGFVVQGGGFEPGLVQRPTRPPIVNEAATTGSNRAGTIAMARTPAIDSATSQFFINLVDNDFLDHSEPTVEGFGYAVFGRVIAGMDVVNTMAAVEILNLCVGGVVTDNMCIGGVIFRDVPAQDIVIERAEVVASCLGDCNVDGVVTVDEVLAMLNIALGVVDPSTCPAGDSNGDVIIQVDEILRAVTNALEGCAD